MISDLSRRARELALHLTTLESVTGSDGECSLPALLREQLTSLDNVKILPLNDGTARSNIFALKRGPSRRTVVLTGHFDTVPFDDYGDLAHLACKPEQLTEHLVRRLRESGNHPQALADFESGEFLAGRGLLDMKAGLAAGLAALEGYGGDLSLLFIGVCDEEERSAGARAAVTQLKTFAAENALEIALVINLDAISDQGDGTKGRVVAFGSIGKQLLTAFIQGKQSHAGYPEDGVNAAYVAAELVTAFELSPALGERTGDEVAAPPTALYAKDLKQGYNVTTPGQAFVYWNTMQYRRPAADVLKIAMDHARQAVARAQARTGHEIALMTVADLLKRSGRGSQQAHLLNLPEQTRLATMEALDAAAITSPAVIVGFGSIPYPAVQLRNEELRAAIKKAVEPYGLGAVHYFAGISDMSFFGETSGTMEAAAINCPIWGTGFTMPEPGGYPCINIGPWGRDYHHWLERVHVSYAFDTLPRVLLAVIDAVAKS